VFRKGSGFDSQGNHFLCFWRTVCLSPPNLFHFVVNCPFYVLFLILLLWAQYNRLLFVFLKQLGLIVDRCRGIYISAGNEHHGAITATPSHNRHYHSISENSLEVEDFAIRPKSSVAFWRQAYITTNFICECYSILYTMSRRHPI
jgi:hypothetical protein